MVALAALVPGAAQALETASIPVPGGPHDIAAGPDGNLWVTQEDGRVARITTTGQVSAFTAGITAGSGPTYITAGPDGNVWFSEVTGDAVGRISGDGAVQEFVLGQGPAGEGPAGITAGPDGNLWFTNPLADSVSRMTPQGAVTAFKDGITPGPRCSCAGPVRITSGPDGNLWFTEGNGDRVARSTPSGVITEFSAGIAPSPLGPGIAPGGIAAGPDGNLWFTEYYTSRIGRITPGGAITEFSSQVDDDLGHSEPLNIVAGPDGNMWFTEQKGTLGRVTMAGAITRFDVGIAANLLPPGIAVGSDRNLWLTDAEHDRVVRIALQASTPLGTPGTKSDSATLPVSTDDVSDDRRRPVPIESQPRTGITGRIDRHGDEDWYSMKGSAVGAPRAIGRKFVVVDVGTGCSGQAPLMIKEYNPEGRWMRTIKVPLSSLGIDVFPPKMPGTYLLEVKATSSECVGLIYTMQQAGGGGAGGRPTGAMLCRIRHGHVIEAQRTVRRYAHAVHHVSTAARPRYRRLLSDARKALSAARNREARVCR